MKISGKWLTDTDDLGLEQDLVTVFQQIIPQALPIT